MLLLLCSCQWQESKVSINETSTVVYQDRHVTREEAARLGAVLLDLGYFDTYDQRTVYLRKEGRLYSVTFLMNKEGFLSDKENNIAGLSVWRQWIQEQALGYAPTQLIIADEQRRPMHIIRAD